MTRADQERIARARCVAVAPFGNYAIRRRKHPPRCQNDARYDIDEDTGKPTRCGKHRVIEFDEVLRRLLASPPRPRTQSGAVR